VGGGKNPVFQEPRGDCIRSGEKNGATRKQKGVWNRNRMPTKKPEEHPKGRKGNLGAKRLGGEKHEKAREIVLLAGERKLWKNEKKRNKEGKEKKETRSHVTPADSKGTTEGWGPERIRTPSHLSRIIRYQGILEKRGRITN